MMEAQPSAATGAAAPAPPLQPDQQQTQAAAAVAPAQATAAVAAPSQAQPAAQPALPMPTAPAAQPAAQPALPMPTAPAAQPAAQPALPMPTAPGAFVPAAAGLAAPPAAPGVAAPPAAAGAPPGGQPGAAPVPGSVAPALPAGSSSVDLARAKFKELGATLLFEKVLTSSDANGTGRIVIPKGQAEAHLPPLDVQQGTTLQLMDIFGKKHSFKFRFWINNQSRMYLLENTQEVQSRYAMQAGDVLVFGKLPDGSYLVLGRKGTKEDMTRKPPAKRSAAAAGVDGVTPAGAKDGKKVTAAVRPRQPTESLKSKRIKQKQATQQVQSAYTYWSGYSLPPRRDGVFRAVPNSAAQEGDKVVAQYGCWTAIVNLGGELYQAFFENYEAANAAFEAAKQSAAARM